MTVVADAGPVVSFARAARLDLLEATLTELAIADAVWEDIVVRGAGRSAARAVSTAQWIQRHTVRDRSLVDDLPERLHLGEREAIVLAKELGLALLVDEREARREAHRLGIEYFGSLRVLKEAKDRGLISAVRPVLDQLISTGTYISHALYHEFLTQLGEEH
ncbi:MAG: DUF3368 domain-containing protein [Acidobacteria bacterium]|nr:DUF3368 domain-containing protein [Acidobacteriota bacterium]